MTRTNMSHIDIDKLDLDLDKLEEENKESEVQQTNPNSLKTRDNSLNNFERFFEDKFHGPSEPIIKQAYKQRGKDGVLILLKSWIAWNTKRGLVPRTIRSMASEVKNKLLKYDIQINKNDLKYPKIIKESRGIMTSDMMEHFINHCDKKRKCLYMLQSCTGMRIMEVINLKRKYLDTTKDRIQINLPGTITKSGESRVSFVSKECEKLLTPIIEHQEPEDLVFDTKKSSEQHAFRRIADLCGFDEKYEVTKKYKINTHCIRAFAITRMNKLNEFGFGHVISGHGFYMKTYNRKESDELLEDYIKAEPYLQIFGREDPTTKKTLAEMSLKIKKLEEKVTIQSQAMAYSVTDDKELKLKLRKQMIESALENPEFARSAKVSREELEDILDEIKTPKVKEVRKCPTCNQESHDKIGNHYKCLNPHCEIDTFQK